MAAGRTVVVDTLGWRREMDVPWGASDDEIKASSVPCLWLGLDPKLGDILGTKSEKHNKKYRLS